MGAFCAQATDKASALAIKETTISLMASSIPRGQVAEGKGRWSTRTNENHISFPTGRNRYFVGSKSIARTTSPRSASLCYCRQPRPCLDAGRAPSGLMRAGKRRCWKVAEGGPVWRAIFPKAHFKTTNGGRGIDCRFASRALGEQGPLRLDRSFPLCGPRRLHFQCVLGGIGHRRLIPVGEPRDYCFV
jgi:hypothetical protein